jgi:hypothetical protein
MAILQVKTFLLFKIMPCKIFQPWLFNPKKQSLQARLGNPADSMPPKNIWLTDTHPK